MKTNSTQQEILLMTNTTFAQREWCRKDLYEGKGDLSEAEQLEEACWNGLVSEIFPELTFEKTLQLWILGYADFFIHLQLGESPDMDENTFSIDPYYFLNSDWYN